MKKVLFGHDHYFKYDLSRKFYSGGGFPASCWSRYLSGFDHVTVIGRDGGFLLEEDNKYTLSSRDAVSFELVANLSNLSSLLFGNKEVDLKIEALVSNHDAIIARLYSNIGLKLVQEAINQNKPYAIELVSCPWDSLWNYGGLTGKIFAGFAAFKVRKAVWRSGFVLYVTSDFLQKRYPCKFGETVACSNVELDRQNYDVLTDRIERVDRIKVPRIGLIGNYTSNYKGIDVAIKSLQILVAYFPHAELHVIGSGDQSYYLSLARELGIIDNIFFPGQLSSGKSVLEFLDTVDIYIQPSLTEGLPRALIEAMSRGCPAIGSRVGGIPELLDNNDTIDPGDYLALAEKIKCVLNNTALHKEMARRNFKKSNEYSFDVLCGKREDFWLGFSKFVES